MNKMTILNRIKSEIKSFIEESVDTSPGVAFSQYKTLKQAYLYRSSKFKNGQTDPLTQKKLVFYQISRFRARVTAKMLDFDIKDLRVISNKIFDLWAQLKAYLLEKKVKNWAKENDFSIVLNEIIQSCADFGSAVVKKHKGKEAVVKDLKYLYIDQSVKYIKDSAYIIEEQKIRRDEVEAKRGIWKNIDELLDSIEDGKKTTIYERYGFIEEDGKFTKRMVVISDAIKSNENGVELFNEEIKEYPYSDFHINKIDGRWLGVGTYEELFDPQIRANTIANQKARALELSSRQIFVTPDEIVARNLLQDLDIGDVLTVPNGLTPLQVESRGLSEFASEEERTELSADRNTFTFDAVRGESLPATTPATNAMLQNQNTISVFEQMKENLATQIVNFIQGSVLPDVTKSSRGEHIMKFVSKLTDLEKFDQLFTSHISEKAAYGYLTKTGFYPEDADVDKSSSDILKKLKDGGLVRSVKLPEGFFSDISDVDFIMDNESRDIPLQAQNLQALLGLVMGNPQAVQDPLVKSLIYAYSELIGISPIELENAQTNQPQQNENIPSPQGGGTTIAGQPGLPTGQGAPPGVLR